VEVSRVGNPIHRHQYHKIHSKNPKKLHGIDVNRSLRTTNILQEVLEEKRELYCMIHDPEQKITRCSCINNFYTSGYTDQDIGLFPQNINYKTNKNTAIADITPEGAKQTSLGVSSAIQTYMSKDEPRADMQPQDPTEGLNFEQTGKFKDFWEIVEAQEPDQKKVKWADLDEDDIEYTFNFEGRQVTNAEFDELMEYRRKFGSKWPESEESEVKFEPIPDVPTEERIFRPERNPKFNERLETLTSENKIPSVITKLAISGYREMEQIAYRLIQSTPDEEGYRHCYVWFNIVDNGEINKMHGELGSINMNYITRTCMYLNMYSSLFQRITGELPIATAFEHKSSEIADEYGNSFMPPEQERGINEYKNSPYFIKDKSIPLMEYQFNTIDFTLLPGLAGNKVYDTRSWETDSTPEMKIKNELRATKLWEEIQSITKNIEDCLDTIELISDSKIHRWTNSQVKKLSPEGQQAKDKFGLYFGFNQGVEEEGVSPGTTRFIREHEWDDISIGFKYELEDLNDERVKLEKELYTIVSDKEPIPFSLQREYWKRFSLKEKDGYLQFQNPLPYVVRLEFKIKAPGYSTERKITIKKEEIRLQESIIPEIEIYSETINKVVNSTMFTGQTEYPMSRLTLQKTFEHVPGLPEHYLELQTVRFEAQRITRECTESLITAALMCRQPSGIKKGRKFVNNFRKLNLSKSDDLACYRYIIFFLEYIKQEFNKLDKRNITEIEDYSDRLISECKIMSSQMRVAWQRGSIQQISKSQKFKKIKLTDLFSWESFNPEVDITDLSARTFQFCSELDPKFMNEPTSVKIDNENLNCSTFTLGQMGYLGRSLPRPTDRYLTQQASETYHRFKTEKEPHEYDDQMKEYTYKWSFNYFSTERAKEIKQRLGTNKFRPNATVSASFERTRSKGGFNTLVSDLFKTMSKLPIESLKKWPNCQKHFELHKELHEEMLMSGNIAKKGQANQDFLTAVSTDYMRPYLDHAQHCQREKCNDLENHLPMWVNSIPELGGKARIPCYTSGFINALAEPIRKKMYEIITKDSRTSFRLKHGDKIHKLKKFLKKFAEEPVSHSGDLTVSTDNFPMWFTQNIIRGMTDSGFINLEESKIALCATGPYRCIYPSSPNRIKLGTLQPRTLKALEIEELFRTALELRRELEMKTLHKTSNNISQIGVTVKKQKGKRNLGSFYQEYELKNEDREFDRHKVVIFKQGTNEYLPEIEHFIRGKIRLTVEIQEKVMKDVWIACHIQSMTSKDNKTLILNDVKPDYEAYLNDIHMDILDLYSPYEKVVEGSKSILPIGSPDKSTLRFIDKGRGPYLTRKGVQMASSISIAMLYSYNLVADTWARDTCGLPHHNCPGALSQLCGDDCLRAGQQDFIDAYRFAIRVLGGIFSKTKDVVGKMPRGIFTEFMFEGAEYLPITKVKTVLRPDKPGAPAWKRAIQAVQSINSRQVDSEVRFVHRGLTNELDFGKQKNYAKVLQMEVMEKYKEKMGRKDTLVTMPTQFGGIGDLSKHGPSQLIKKVLENIRRIKSPITANKAVKILRNPLTVIQNVTRHKNLDAEDLLEFTPDVITEYDGKASKLRHRLYHEGKVRWLKDISQGLRGKIEVASMLENPPYNDDFEGDTVQVLKDKEAIEKCYDYLHSRGVADFHGQSYLPGLRNSPLPLGPFLAATMFADIPMEYIQEIIGPDLEVPGKLDGLGLKEQA
jgi:hypothetical protein